MRVSSAVPELAASREGFYQIKGWLQTIVRRGQIQRARADADRILNLSVLHFSYPCTSSSLPYLLSFSKKKANSLLHTILDLILAYGSWAGVLIHSSKNRYIPGEHKANQ